MYRFSYPKRAIHPWINYILAIVSQKKFNYTDTHGNVIKQFNQTLNQKLSSYVFEIDANDKEAT